MTRTVALTCDNCGAPLDVPEQVRFVTCDHCNARLRIERTDGAVFTKILEAFARVEKQSSATAAAVRVIELEREIERIDADLAKLSNPGGSGLVWMCGAIACLFGIAAIFIDDDPETQGNGILGALIFGGFTVWLAIVLPGRRRKYAASHTRLEAKRAQLEEQLEAARADEITEGGTAARPKNAGG